MEYNDREDKSIRTLIVNEAKKMGGTTKNILRSAKCESLWKGACEANSS